jgi:hypothetical protein
MVYVVTAVGLMLTVADQESAAAGPSTKKECRPLSGSSALTVAPGRLRHPAGAVGRCGALWAELIVAQTGVSESEQEPACCGEVWSAGTKSSMERLQSGAKLRPFVPIMA